MQDVLTQNAAPGIRSAEDKERLAQAWLDLAVTLAKIPVKYDADRMKKQQKTNGPGQTAVAGSIGSL